MSFGCLISWARFVLSSLKSDPTASKFFAGSERRIIYPDRKEGFHSRPGVQVKLPMVCLGFAVGRRSNEDYSVGHLLLQFC